MRQVIGIVVAVVIFGFGAARFYSKYRHPIASLVTPPPPPAEPVALALPEAPPPEALVWAGPSETDADGYPRNTPSAVSLVAMLRHRQFDRLTSEMETLDRAAAEDPKKEYWAVDAADAFAMADPALAPLLDAWVERQPPTFAAYLARGAYRSELAWFYRGTAASEKTTKARFEKQKATLELARADLERAIELNPRALAPHVLLVRNAKADDSGEREFERGVAKFPLSFNLHHQRLVDLTPRWGGSLEQVAAFAALGATKSAENPRLRLLSGFVDWARALDLQSKGDHAGALADLARARGHGEHWVFYRALADSKAALGDLNGALADANAALALRPEFVEVLVTRADVAAQLKLFDLAADSFLAALRLDPTSGQNHLPQYANMAAQAGLAHQRAGRPREALQAYDKALLIMPAHPGAQLGRTEMLRRGDPYESEHEMQALVEKARRDDTFEAYRILDVELGRRRRFAELLAHWNEYLARHPNDGQALLERAGTFTQVDDREGAVGDADKACSLGIQPACAAAQRLRASASRPNVEARAN